MTIEEGEAATYTVSLSRQPAAGVEVRVSGDLLDRFHIDRTSLAFTRENWDTPQTVTVKAHEDADSVDDSLMLTHIASGGGYDSAERARVTARTMDDERRPSAPRNLAATPGNGRVTLAWTAPERSGDSAIVRYEYHHAAGYSVPEQTAWTSAGAAPMVTVNGLTNGTRYAFRVRAVNGAGSDAAAIAAATPEPDPIVTVRPEHATYRFAEGASGAAVTLVARTGPNVRRPNTRFHVSLSSRAVPGGAELRADYEPFSVVIAFDPDDFTAAGTAWEARKSMPLTLHEDGSAENDEIFTVLLERSPGMPSWVRLRRAEGEPACSHSSCPVIVTIADIDGAPSPLLPVLSIANTTGDEDDGHIRFTISLTRATEKPVSVDFRTIAGGTATAHVDYRPVDETIVIPGGSTTWNVDVALFDDPVDDDGETVKVRIGNAWLLSDQGVAVRPLDITGAEATGTINNSDPMPRAWLSRFGRTVAAQVMDAVDGRLRASRRPGVEATLAGQRFGGALGPRAGEAGAGAESVPEPGARARLEAAASWLRSHQDEGHTGLSGLRRVSERDLLTGTAFAMTGEREDGGSVALWGRGVVSRFDGRQNALSLDGEVESAMVGADWTRERGTVGLALAQSRGEGGYRRASEGDDRTAGEGRMESALTGVYPYGRSNGVRIRCRLGLPGKVRRQPVQVEERRDVGIPALPEGVPEEAQHPLLFERAAFRMPRSGDDSRINVHIPILKGGSQNLVDEDFFGLALAEDDDILHRLGLPPNMFIFQSSPSAYSSNHSLRSSRSSLVKVDAPSLRSTTTTSSGSSSLTRSADCVEAMTCLQSLACWSISATRVSAAGCRPSSGSSMSISSGCSSTGCRRRVERQMKRSVPSDNWRGPRTVSGSSAWNHSRSIPSPISLR